MFNVCDPVICPNSRCDLGGTYPVSDVMQTGIIGSIFLCLPNVKEGIIIPVCLTGIHAGIDNYISIMEAYRGCLQENIDSGRYVGICDQITAIYKCEFFWRQISPLINTIIPKLLESLSGEGSRGGGEYLGVQSAWDNMQDSVDYFKGFYGDDAIRQFNIRSTDEVGGEVCKSFISTKYPNKFKTLIEPDSPTQFSAWFSEIPQTSATVPAISHYKVFYHIFAGNDQGVYYSVYLKNRAGESFFDEGGYVTVSTGFINKGDYKDSSDDFTAPSGYKELCVRINGKDDCGFKQVSTSFALNYVQDKYAQNQIDKVNIRTERECIAGTPNALAAVNPNIQAGLEESAMPQIYQRGIIRVCATDNPGSAVDSTRWVRVGVCGDTNVGCWLDKESVGDAIGGEGIRDKTMEELDDALEDYENAENEKRLASEGEFIGRLGEISLEVSKLDDKDDVVGEARTLNAKLDDLEDELILVEGQRAEVLLQRARIDRAVAGVFWEAVLGSRAGIRADLMGLDDGDTGGGDGGGGDTGGGDTGEKDKECGDITDPDECPESVLGCEWVPSFFSWFTDGGWCVEKDDGGDVDITELDCADFKEETPLSVEYKGCISANKIDQILDDEGSPAKETGATFVELGNYYNIDPIFALAFFNQESKFGTLGVAKSTKSIGNIKYNEFCPGVEVKVGSSGFCKYGASDDWISKSSYTDWQLEGTTYTAWELSIEHWYQLISKGYVNKGLDTLEKIAPRYCPSDVDANCKGYITNIRKFVLDNRV